MSPAIALAPLEAPPPEFQSGHAELDDWLAKHALQATRAGSARVYLAHADRALVGYLALAAGSVEHERADQRSRRGMPRHPIPAVLLARLAVAEAAQGQGFGRVLVGHAASLALRASRLIAIRLLVVDALDQPTAGFYERLGFTRPAPNSLRLGMLIKDIEGLV